METIKIKTRVETEVEREVTLPFYSKSASSYYKVITKDCQISVSFLNEKSYNIWKAEFLLGLALQGEQITEEEFNEVYNKVKSLL